MDGSRCPAAHQTSIFHMREKNSAMYLRAPLKSYMVPALILQDRGSLFILSPIKSTISKIPAGKMPFLSGLQTRQVFRRL